MQVRSIMINCVTHYSHTVGVVAGTRICTVHAHMIMAPVHCLLGLGDISELSFNGLKKQAKPSDYSSNNS
jgi:hypothetical protein